MTDALRNHRKANRPRQLQTFTDYRRPLQTTTNHYRLLQIITKNTVVSSIRGFTDLYCTCSSCLLTLMYFTYRLNAWFIITITDHNFWVFALTTHSTSSYPRDYPTNVYQDVIYTFRTMYENAKRLYSITTPWHEAFELDNAEARNVPEDPANFHLSQINS